MTGRALPHQAVDVSPFAAPARALVLALLAVCVVIPHSLQLPTAALFALAAMTGLLTLRAQNQVIGYVGICYLLSLLVTLTYLIVGMAHGAPDIAIYQILAVYVVSPLLWLIIWHAAFQLMPKSRVIGYLIALCVPACLTVALFFFLFISFGPDAVRFFAETGNISFDSGITGATMHVYGSMIFLTGAVFAAPELIKRNWQRIGLLVALSTVAITSGRSALILAIPIGTIAGLVIRQHVARLSFSGLFRYAVFLVVALALLVTLIQLFTTIDLLAIVDATVQKISQGGGEARTEQSAALIEGIRNTNGLGAGHGIGVSLIRNDDYPWRYENVFLANIYRVGFAGAVIYAIVWLITFGVAIRSILARQWVPQDTFVFAGMSTMLLAAPTNPYLESFIFQWSFTLPLVYFSRPRDTVERRA